MNLEKEALTSKKKLKEILAMQFDPIIRIELKVIVDHIRRLNQSIAELEKTIAEEGGKLEGHQELLTSIKGIGPLSGRDEVLGDRSLDAGSLVEKPKRTPVPFPADEPLALECRHFRKSVEQPLHPKIDGADAWRVLKVLEASQRSLATNGEPVQLQSHSYLEAVHA